jgi:hypothetical protein
MTKGRAAPPWKVVAGQKAVDGLRPSFSAQVRLGEPGAPVGFLRVCFQLRVLGGVLWCPTQPSSVEHYCDLVGREALALVAGVAGAYGGFVVFAG